MSIRNLLPIMLGITLSLSAAFAADTPAYQYDLVTRPVGDGESWNCRLQSFVAVPVPVEAVLQRAGVGSPLERMPLKGLAPGRPVEFNVNLNKHGLGTYELAVFAATQEVARDKLYYLDTPWRKIDLDAPEVLAPWSPVEVSGNTVRLWGRVYNFATSALPASITSQGRELLAGGVAVTAEIAGGRVVFGRVTPQAKSMGPGRAVLTATAESRPGDLRLTTSCELEYDGLAMLEIGLSGKDLANVTKLELAIPVPGNVVKYIYRTGLDRQWVSGRTGLRAKPGIVVQSDFMPMAWLGDDDAGLFWFCDSNRAWPRSLAGRADAIQVVDDGAVVTLKMLISAGETLVSPWKLRIGLMATPVKPGGNGTGWRKRDLSTSCTAGVVDALVWPMPKVFVDANIPEPCDPVSMKNNVRAIRDSGKIPMCYTAYALPVPRPEWKVYGDPWHLDGQMDMFYGEAWMFHPEPHDDGAWMCACPETEFNTWITWKIGELLKEYGWGGYYRDGIYYGACASRRHGHGLKGAYDFHMESLRKHYRYLYTQVHKRAPQNSWVFFHSSGLIPIPLLAYCDSVAFAEDLNGVNTYNGDYRKIISMAELRNQFMGKAWGFRASFLPELFDGNVNPKNTRTMLALLLLHDIGLWSANVDGQTVNDLKSQITTKFNYAEAEYLPYFSEAVPVKAVGNDVYVSVYRQRNGRTLAVVANMSYRNLRTTVTFKPQALGLRALTRVTDLEHDFAYPLTNNSVNVVVRQGDYRLLVAE